MSMMSSQREPQPRADSRQLVIVGGLMLLIIGLLAFLWTRERSRRVTAQRQLAVLHQRHDALNTTLANVLVGRAEDSSRKVRREDLPQEQALLNGKKATVMRISATAGERMGFRPGDIIIVSPRPAQPATDSAQQDE